MTDDTTGSRVAEDTTGSRVADDTTGSRVADDTTTPDQSVPADAERFDCPHCDRVFARERHRDLHRGQTHPDAVSEAAATAYREAARAEWAALRRYRYVALGALVLLYFGFLVAFAVVGT